MSPSAPSRILLTNTGGYPCNGDSSDEQILARTLQAACRGERTAADLFDAQNVVTRFVITEQVRAGVELVTDGMVRWADPISHVAAKFHGIALGGEQQFAAGNFRYRQPVLRARPKKMPDGRGSLAEEYRFACNALGLLPTLTERAGRLSVQAVLPGPFTLARVSCTEVDELRGFEARAEAFAEALAAEVTALANSGAPHIQIEERALAGASASDAAVFARVFPRLLAARDAARKAGKHVHLALYVPTEAASLPVALLGLPVDVLTVECLTSARLPDGLATARRAMGIAVLDSRSDAVESADEVALRIEGLIRDLPSPTIFLGPTAGLETRPRNVAFEKLRTLTRVREVLTGRW